MERDAFFPRHEGVALGKLAERIGASLHKSEDADVMIRSVAPVYRAVEGDICYMLSRKNRAELETCRASAIICDEALLSLVPGHIPALVAKSAHAAFALAGLILHPSAARPETIAQSEGISPLAVVHPTSVLEPGVIVEPHAVIGAHVAIGAGSRIGPGAMIGNAVKIGRDCTIAGGASVLCSLIGNNVIIHNGARIGQDGFGYAPGPTGMIKIVQIGRVIIQDNVEIGAETTIDRGTMDDTVIGEGTKIDNQVQIGHNVQIGRHCALVSKVGVAGSAKIGNGVQIGGAAGINGHISIGDGAQVAAMSGVMNDVPPGEKVAGQPARPIKEFFREIAERAARSGARKAKGGESA
ncbi:UDP-3-O-[3-hydroxymyristoyl] glucosamine N-acyltransferase [Rhizobium aquaticum]|uniref:UDP-3-O-acylglucosamine N-acyltransferase n=1 Tax=Rhizobium aquaticum TaxID=1549636 RepID=A0ABV2IW18_9HYPH